MLDHAADDALRVDADQDADRLARIAASDLRWAPIDLVAATEISDIGNSSLATPYTAWALAARDRQRAFVFWTYVIALAEDPLVRLAAEEKTSPGKRCRMAICGASAGWPGGP